MQSNRPKPLIAITGASSGIGWALAEQLHAQNYPLLLIARNEEKLQKLQAALDGHPDTLALDVRDAEAVKTSLSKHPIDVLVNNAGLSLGMDSFADTPLDDLMTVIDTNIKGLVNCAHAVLPGMLERNQGYIINLGSVAGDYSYPGGHVYGASKAFVKQFSLNLRADLVDTNIRVTNIEPGLVDTNFFVTRFHGDQQKVDGYFSDKQALQAADIANAIAYCIQLPEHTNINRLEVMNTHQASAGFKFVSRS